MNDGTSQEDQFSTESGVDEDQVSFTESLSEEVRNGLYSISRPIYDKSRFLRDYDHYPDKDVGLREKLASRRPDVSCRTVFGLLTSFVPLLTWLPKYKVRRNLPSDIAAGLTVGVMNIPQGLAYALLASLPPIVGLYTSFMPVLVYFVLGTSRHIAIGTFAIISTMVGEVCEREIAKYDFVPGNSSGNATGEGEIWTQEDEQKLKIAVSLTLLVGIIQAAMGLVHLGFVTAYLSRPLVSGFTTGAAFIVFTSQVKYFFGIHPPRYSGALALPKTYVYLFKHITDTNVAALLTGLICVLLLVAVDYINRKYKSHLPYPIPSQLLVIIIGAVVSHTADLKPRFNVWVVGNIPKGLPNLHTPEQKYFVDLILDAFLIAIVAATTNLSLVKLFSQKHEYPTDSNQELVAYGVANIISSFFSSFVSSGSLSRSVVQEGMGKTQIASFVSSVVILLVLLFIAPLFEPLPKPVLAAIVVVSLRRLFMQFSQLKSIGKISQVDAFIWFVSCFAVVLLGIVMGLITGFGVTLLSIIYRASRANIRTLGHVSKTEFYKDPERCLSTKPIPGIQVVQFEGPLIFVNAENLRDAILEIVRENCPDRKKCIVDDSKNLHVSVDAAGTLPGNLVETVVSDGDKQIKLTMIRNLNPMSAVESFNNLGSDDFTEEVTSNETELAQESATPQSPVTKIVEKKLHSIILDFFSVTMIDYVGILCLRQIIEKSKEMGVHIYLAGCSYYTHRHMSRDNFLVKFIDDNSFLSVHDAVLFARKKSRLLIKIAEQPSSSDTGEQQVIA